MGGKFASLRSTFSVEDEIVGEDTRFLKVVIDAMHTEKNLNGSYFDKSVVNECLESVKNTPILGFIKCDKFTGEDDFKGHEYVLKRTENGVEEVYIGRAYGVVPESCNPRWVVKVCDDGIEREFLQVDALVWEKFSDATSIIKRDGEKPESMELEMSSVEGYEDEDGIFHFTKFRFDGFCILGDSVQPAMMNASVRVNDGVNFAMSDIVDSVRSELNDKFEKFSIAFTMFANGEVCSNQGGAKNMLDTDFKQIDECAAQTDDVEVVEATAEFEAEQTSETEEVVEEVVEYEAEAEVVEEIEEQQEEAEVVEEQVPAEEAKFEEVSEEEEEETIEEEIVADDSRFADMQTEIDALKIEFEKVKTEYDEVVASYGAIKAEYEALKSEYDEIKPKYDEYVQAEAQRVAEELSAQKDAAFAEYEADLAENAEFAALKEKKSEMSVEDIEKECAFLYVKIARAKNKFSAVEQPSAVVGVIGDSDSYESDGLVLTKYGYISTSK